jgi:hypothetical protein
MTIDERLDRLTERHEALTQSVALTVRMTQDNARNIGMLGEQMGTLKERIDALIREASASLLQIAQLHENRISGLEGGK